VTSAEVPDDGAAFDLAAERPRLVGLAYRMLGSLVDAEDVVQEACLRWSTADTGSIERPAAWLTTVTSRLAIDRIRQVARRREDYVGPWLPEPVPTAAGVADPRPWGAGDPAARVELEESLTTGFLVVLDELGELERVVFVLADVFAVPHAEIATIVDRSEVACRQLASRARRKVRAARAVRAAADEGLLAELVGAITRGDPSAVVELLSPDVVLHSDGGPRRRAARRPVRGPDRVARLLVNLATRVPPDARLAVEEVNAAPALVVRSAERPLVLSADRDAATGAVTAVRLQLNPDKLAALDRAVALR
jgi:RNA polymerase sigma-70 factor (ECF subfamily)